MRSGEFTATEQAASLQRVLVNLVALRLQGKQAQWTTVASGGGALGGHLDELVDDLGKSGDRVAERIRELGAVPDGRAPTVVAGAGLDPFPLGEHTGPVAARLVADRLRTVAGVVRAARDDVDADDPATADLLRQIVESIDRHASLVGAEAEQV